MPTKTFFIDLPPQIFVGVSSQRLQSILGNHREATFDCHYEKPSLLMKEVLK